jgi:glycosyltransferase involved in cell wall biosynthesis
VYHFHDPELLPVGLLLRLTTCAKVIYDVHEDVPEQVLTKHWIPRALRRPAAAAVGFGEKLLARAVDAVVVATEGIAERFVRFDPVVIRNYPSLSMLPCPAVEERSRHRSQLIYVGGIGRLRGAFEMVQALVRVAQTCDVRLRLIGRFEPPGIGEELSALPGWKRVRMLGWLDPPAVYEELKHASIGLVCLHPAPRYIVALPVKLFEYMAAGLPVVASSFPLWKEIVEGNECGLCVDPLDPQAIAAAIEYLIAHPDKARRMGENGRRAVEEKYNWERESEKLLALYDKLLSR